ncbi:hypothetical protein [Acuticoccus sp.]
MSDLCALIREAMQGPFPHAAAERAFDVIMAGKGRRLHRSQAS